MIASSPKARQASMIHSVIFLVLLNGGLAGAIMLAYYLFGFIGLGFGLLIAILLNLFVLYERNRENFINVMRWIYAETEDY